MIKQLHVIPIMAFFSILSCATTKSVQPLEGIPPNAPAKTIEMTAEKYDFTPPEIRIKAGTLVKLVISSNDRKHGIEIKRYGIKQEIPAKEEGAVTVEFYAREKGEYKFKCSEFCGLGHLWMGGRIIVE